MITTFDTGEYIYGALQAGARGFLLKGAEPDRLIQAIQAAVRGDALIDPVVTGRLLATFAARGPGRLPARPLDALTDREEDVLGRVAMGRTNVEIAGAAHQHEHGEVPRDRSDDQAGRPQPLAMWAYQTNRVTLTIVG